MYIKKNFKYVAKFIGNKDFDAEFSSMYDTERYMKSIIDKVEGYFVVHIIGMNNVTLTPFDVTLFKFKKENGRYVEEGLESSL